MRRPILLALLSLTFLLRAFAAFPVITGISPLKGPPGTHVVITGRNFIVFNGDPEFRVEFNGVRATVLFATSSGLEVIVPSDATTGPVSVFNRDGQDSTTSDFQPSPRVTDAYTSLDLFGNPVRPVKATAGQDLTITGFNFVDPAGRLAIFIGGARAAGFASAETQIHATVPAAAQSGPVIVTNSAGASTNGIVYLNPVIETFPPSAAVGDTIDIVGRSFFGATAFTIGGAPATFTVRSGTNIQAVVPATAVDGKLSVASPGGTYITVGTFRLLPQVTGFTPVGGPVGTVVMLDGTGLGGITSVRFGEVAATKFTNISAVKLTAVVPQGASTAPIRVGNAIGTNVTATPFYAAPVVASFAPSSGRPGDDVVLTGANFTGATRVELGGVDVPQFTVTATNKISAKVPADAMTGSWRVTTPGGTDVSDASFTVIGPTPTVASFNPVAGPPGTQVTITGQNLSTATKVEFNGVPAAFTVAGAGLLATVPATATTGPVRVTNPAGQAVSASSFTVGGSADLRVTFTASAPAIAHGPLSFSLQVVNRGPLPANGAKAVVTLPATAAFDSVSGFGDFDVVGSKVTFNLGDLVSGATVSAFVRVRLGAPATLSAKAEVSSATNDDVPGNNSAAITVVSAYPSLSLEPADSAEISLQWTSLATNYVIETTPWLTTPAAWTPVTEPPVDDGVSRQLVLPLGSGDAYYRLRLK